MLARWLVRLGAGLVAVGLFAGFGAMLLDADGRGVQLIGLVPLGFVLLLAGTVGVLLGPGDGPRRRPPEP